MFGVFLLAVSVAPVPAGEGVSEEGTETLSTTEAVEPQAPREPFAFAWSASFDAGFPLNGLALGRTIRGRWLLRAGIGMGYPVPVLAGGATASISRGFVLGRIATLAPGVVVNGFATRFCFAGGCGERHRYLGVGPSVALHLYVPPVKRVWLGFGIGGGVTFSVVRERMRLVQPHVQALSVTVGWPRRPER